MDLPPIHFAFFLKIGTFRAMVSPWSLEDQLCSLEGHQELFPLPSAAHPTGFSKSKKGF